MPLQPRYRPPGSGHWRHPSAEEIRSHVVSEHQKGWASFPTRIALDLGFPITRPQAGCPVLPLANILPFQIQAVETVNQIIITLLVKLAGCIEHPSIVPGITQFGFGCLIETRIFEHGSDHNYPGNQWFISRFGVHRLAYIYMYFLTYFVEPRHHIRCIAPKILAYRVKSASYALID